jgi:hypothetical protein
MSPELSERTPEIVEPWLAERIPIGRAGLPVDIANATLWLASSESSFVTGHALVIDGGFTAGIRWSEAARRIDQLRERFRSALGQTTSSRNFRFRFDRVGRLNQRKGNSPGKNANV